MKEAITLETIQNSINSLGTRMEEKFTQIDNRFEQVDKRFEQIDKRFEQIDKRFLEIDIKLNTLNKKIDDKFDFLNKKIDAKFLILDEKLETSFKILADRIEDRHDSLYELTSTGFKIVENDIKTIATAVNKSQNLFNLRDRATINYEKAKHWGGKGLKMVKIKPKKQKK